MGSRFGDWNLEYGIEMWVKDLEFCRFEFVIGDGDWGFEIGVMY